MAKNKGLHAEGMQVRDRPEPEAHHDAVVSNLMDLQARLRAGAEVHEGDVSVRTEPAPAESAGLLILHDGAGVPSLASAAADTEARLAALMNRLNALESGLGGVVQRLEGDEHDRVAVVEAFASELVGFRSDVMRLLDDRLEAFHQQAIDRLDGS